MSKVVRFFSLFAVLVAAMSIAPAAAVADTGGPTVLTGCNFTVAKIEMSAQIQRSRWYGWETMATETNVGYNLPSLPNDVTCNCGGTGVHDFRVVASGVITLANGTSASASAFDDLAGVNCG
ncbi:hypothetical protein L6E12_08665 [Actinokineospora sp. PR83]|uniref:hypothetical protein n=1 Tax=Actinokineospora sp. PR83 TaxID=2884908 RepID=UPI001F2B48EB|nr:hypothetical protein [Actinokineospora sp. PR83]MCG8915857.1 hypothetical protein [Actinokineospora sp. PR83]